MFDFQNTLECVVYIEERLAKMAAFPFQERLTVVLGNSRGLRQGLRQGEVFSRGEWQRFGRGIVTFVRLYLAQLLRQRGLETNFEGGFGYLYDLYHFKYLMQDLETFAGARDWFRGLPEDELLSATLQARLEIAVKAGKRIIGKQERGESSEGSPDRDLFEGMLEQIFILVIGIPLSPRGEISPGKEKGSEVQVGY